MLRELPATSASIPAVSPAVSAVPAASSSASSTAAAATSASSTATAEAASASATTGAASSAFARRTRLVHDDFAAHEVLAIQGLNGARSLVVIFDFDKPESARLARKTVAHQADVGSGGSRLCK
jgi:hypothetical protein